MQAVWTAPCTSSTAIAYAVPRASNTLVASRVFRPGQAALVDAGRGDTVWIALVGGSVAAVLAGQRLASRRSALHGRARGAVVAVKAGGKDSEAVAIQEAAAALTEATYPFMCEVPWNSNEFLLTPGGNDPIHWTKAIGKIIDMGADMDAELVKAGCVAHHVANTNLSPNGVCSETELTEIYAAIGRMIASVPESKTMEVYDSVKGLVDSEVPAYLMSKVTEANAKAAYDALIKFTEVVKANPITPSTPPSTVSIGAASSISTAASELGKAAYPFMQGVDWTDNLWATPLPGRSAQEVLKAVDKMIVMGSKMDGAALQEAARAHVKAIEGMDAKGVLTQKDFEAILAGLGKAISSVPALNVMDVYHEVSGLTESNRGIPTYIFSKQNPVDAIAAYSALMKFKDTVKAYQPNPIDAAAAKLAKETYPFMQEVPWNSPEFLLTPGTANPIRWAEAIGEIIDMGASMDAELVKAGCQAHHVAILDLPDNGVCSEAQLKDIYASIGRMVASVPEYKTMEVFRKVSALVSREVPEYLMSKMTEKNARVA